jgi:dolichyl-phosphate-mannose--protein O-mannosyl transferase
MNSMYFDEIYHGRTAFEHLRNIFPYEITHPPLGKLIIEASISVFGMTAFGWRFIGAVFGVLMLIVMYIFLKNVFGKTVIAVCGTLLFGFDFMRFVQTRIATIDTYGVIFILLSFFFMYRHITTDPDAPFKKSLAPLALSGLSFGFGCAAKWIVPYAGIGLAVIYVIRLVMLAKYYDENRRQGFGGYLTKTLLFSVLFFVILPAMIYYLSYIPYGWARDMTIRDGMLWDKEFYSKIFWENQKYMLKYHGKDVLTSTHPYSSRWYQWIVNGRPILYYREYNGDMRSSFAAFGNPVVWWGGLIAMIAMAIRAVRRRDGKSLFILIGYLSQLLPWVAIPRVVFAYHYFPSTLFLVMALSHVLNTILERRQGMYKQIVYGFTASAGVVFALFYPALTGIYAPNWYFRYLLRWIPDAWPF